MNEEVTSASYFSISFAGSMYWYLWPAAMGGTALLLWMRTRMRSALAMGIGFLMSGLFVAIAHNIPRSAVENYTGDPELIYQSMEPVNQNLHAIILLVIQTGFVVALVGFVFMSIRVAKGLSVIGEQQ